MLKRLQALVHFCIGEIHLKHGKLSAAEARMSRAIWLYPNIPFGYVDRGVALQGMGEHSRAIDDFDRAIDLAPRFAMVYSNRGSPSW